VRDGGDVHNFSLNLSSSERHLWALIWVLLFVSHFRFVLCFCMIVSEGVSWMIALHIHFSLYLRATAWDSCLISFEFRVANHLMLLDSRRNGWRLQSDEWWGSTTGRCSDSPVPRLCHVSAQLLCSDRIKHLLCVGNRSLLLNQSGASRPRLRDGHLPSISVQKCEAHRWPLSNFSTAPRPSDDSCIPYYPKHGQWLILQGK
jgi:hypothetical protein